MNGIPISAAEPEETDERSRGSSLSGNCSSAGADAVSQIYRGDGG